MEVQFFDPSKHYVEVASWWSKRKWPIIPPDMLSKLGIVVQKDGENICAGWLYRTDSTVAWLEFIVANPGASGKMRYKALDLLIETLLGHAKNMGFEAVFSSLKHRGLMKKFEKAGFLPSDSGMTNMIRRF
jgi:hypothetical protein